PVVDAVVLSVFGVLVIRVDGRRGQQRVVGALALAVSEVRFVQWRALAVRARLTRPIGGACSVVLTTPTATTATATATTHCPLGRLFAFGHGALVIAAFFVARRGLDLSRLLG